MVIATFRLLTCLGISSNPKGKKTSEDYAAFSTPFGSFKWLRMPMGLTDSLKTFQSPMEKVLPSLTCKPAIPYLDDCISFSHTKDKYLESFREVFKG